MSLVSIDPSTGKKIQKYKEISISGIDEKLQEAFLSQNNWRNTDLEFRLNLLNEMKGVLEDGKREYAQLMAL
ncbi:MAG: aldehyde dehydrogenase family protein, partial [Candidatus Neomarinimicrobiota bacterium]